MSSSLPDNPNIAYLWKERRDLLDQVKAYNDAITALQKLCRHPNEIDVSRHGSPHMECPDCGKGRLP